MNHRSQGYEPCEIPLLYPAINPDSRVSKVFNVLYLSTRRFGLRPLFNLQIPSEPVSVKDTHPRKEEPMKKCLCQVAATTYKSSL